MRFLNKFYSFVKSIYLNNSKYSNNLRHTLRIFFEREVKTKYTPALFGTVFKGSKWVDYQTYNINKLFLKSGLSYFYYVLVVLTTLFILLGRSKSEQYFGYLPLFSYINFMLGYIPLIMHDLCSQIFFTIFITYSFVISYINKLVHSLSLTFFYNLSNTTKLNPNLTNKVTPITYKTNYNYNFTKLTNNSINKSPNNKVVTTLNFSKILSNAGLNIGNTVNPNLLLWASQTKPFVNTFNLSLLKLVTYNPKNISFRERLVTFDEAPYIYNTFRNSKETSSKNTRINLYNLNQLVRVKGYPNLFNFNIEDKLLNAKQYRWLAKNSLLSGSLLNNSSLITQSKKIIGLSLYSHDYSSTSLWLPTKTSKLSSIESIKYVSNLNNSLSGNLSKHGINFNKLLNLTQSNFQNLNFFENSRFWVFKKYFFSNQQSSNATYEYPLFNGRNSVFSKTYPNSVNLNYHLNLTNTQLLNNLSNNLSPSVNTYNTNLKNLYVRPKTSLNIKLPNLDILNGLNINFFYIITSNPQSNNSNINYYTNPIDSSTSGNSLRIDHTGVKFTKI